MSKKENNKSKSGRLSIVIATLALLVSGITLYLQYFYDIQNLYMQTTTITTDDESLDLNLLFYNKGNQYAAIVNCRIGISEEYRNVTNIKYSLSEKDIEPQALEPGQMYILKIHRDISFEEKQELLGTNIYPNLSKTLYNYLHLSFIDDLGQMHSKFIYIGTIDFNGNTIIGGNLIEKRINLSESIKSKDEILYFQ